MEKILGIDTGTDSLGWAIVEREGDCCRLIDKGVNIFQEGVKEDKGIEASKAAERTLHRSVQSAKPIQRFNPYPFHLQINGLQNQHQPSPTTCSAECSHKIGVYGGIFAYYLRPI